MTSPLESESPFSADESPGDDFPSPSFAQWIELAERSLKGGSVDQLAAETAGGIRIKTLYTAEDLLPDMSRAVGRTAAGSGPEACVRIDATDADAALSRIAEALRLGAGSLWLTLGAGGQTPNTAALAALAEASADVPVHLDAGVATVEDAAPLITAFQASTRCKPDGASCSIGCDPLGRAAAYGAAAQAIHADLEAMPELAAWAQESAPGFTALTVSTMPHHGAGASEVDELAIALATGVEYLRTLDAAGIDISARPAPLRMITAMDRDVFTEMAKLRAVRLLWARVMASCGAPAEHRGLTVHAVSSPRCLTTSDRWVNLLRITTEAAAAIIGGADALTTLPFDAAIGDADELSRRLAVNTQTILREEAHLGRVQDPASGSWYVESLTDQLCGKAWQLFQEIEAEGGMTRFLLSGALHRMLSASSERRRQAVATRAAPITGVTSYPNLAEEPVGRPPVAVATPDGPTDLADALPPLPERRDSRDVEALRDASDRHLLEHGVRPRVFLVTMGPAPDHAARAKFAKGLFEVGGVETVASGALADVEAAAEAFAASSCRVAVLCASDSWYEMGVQGLTMELTRRGARTVILVGDPGAHETSWREAGVQDFVFPGCDVLDILGRCLEGLGVRHG